MKKKLFLIRHAQRDVFDSSDDNGLNDKGKRQALAVRDHFKKELGNKKISLYSSPRVRCQETLAPLSKALKVEVEVLPLLDESAHTQNGRIEKRVADFIEWWKSEAPELAMACSHGDWIPLFFDEALNKSLNLKKAGCAELKFKDGEIVLKDIIQSWDIEA